MHTVYPQLRPQVFVQMRGDGVFIPAGAAHQVQNLADCVKIALDFVSPQGVANAYRVTQQLRGLTSKHTNRADKLQLCNIVREAQRAAISVLGVKDEPHECWL